MCGVLLELIKKKNYYCFDFYLHYHYYVYM